MEGYMNPLAKKMLALSAVLLYIGSAFALVVASRQSEVIYAIHAYASAFAFLIVASTCVIMSMFKE